MCWDDEPCPSRPGLNHTRSYPSGQCYGCGKPVGLARERPGPPLDVAQRLEALGLVGPGPIPTELIEQRAITGNGPQGSKYRPGRSRDGQGSLIDSDRHALEFHVKRIRRGCDTCTDAQDCEYTVPGGSC